MTERMDILYALSPPISWKAITPNDSADIDPYCHALNVSADASVKVTCEDGTVTTLFIAAGIAFPCRVKRIWATGTTGAITINGAF